MRISYIFFIVTIFLTVNVCAQKITRQVSANGSAEVGGLYSYTLGQAVVGDLQNNQSQIHQGYQQNVYDQTNYILSENHLESITIFPNPASQFVNIDFAAKNSITGQIQLRSILGQLLETVSFENENDFQTNLSVQMLPVGFYTFSIKDDKGNLLGIQKLLIKN